MSEPTTMMTFGHGTAERDELAALLRGARVERVVDVRRFPGSRRNDAAARGHIEDLARELGIDYAWDERLGGRRQRPVGSAGSVMNRRLDVRRPNLRRALAQFLGRARVVDPHVGHRTALLGGGLRTDA